MSEEKIKDEELEELEEEEVVEVEADDNEPEEKRKVKNKQKQVRYIFQSEKGWYEKERDNVRITKYYRTQEEAIDAARRHIKNSGMAGSIVVQSRSGKIRANMKVAAAKD